MSCQYSVITNWY